MATIPIKKYGDSESYQRSLGALLDGLRNPNQIPSADQNEIRFQEKLPFFSRILQRIPSSESQECIQKACLRVIKKNAEFATLNEVASLHERLQFSLVQKERVELRILSIQKRSLGRQIASQERILGTQKDLIRANQAFLSQCSTAMYALDDQRRAMRNPDVLFTSFGGAQIPAHLDIVQCGVLTLKSIWEESMSEGKTFITSMIPVLVDYSNVPCASTKSVELFLDFQYGQGVSRHLTPNEYIDFVLFADHLGHVSLVKQILAQMIRLRDPLVQRQILRTMASKSLYFAVDRHWPIFENWILHFLQWQESVNQELLRELELLAEERKEGALILLSFMDLKEILQDQNMDRICRFLRAAGPIPFAQALLSEAYKELDRQEESVAFALSAAHGGSSLGEVLVGWCYQWGWRVDRDPKQAIFWYQRAASQNNSEALSELSFCYELGCGVSCDQALAYEFAHRSAKQGNIVGIAREADCLDQGIGIEENAERALSILRLLADTGDAYSLARVGEFYEEGRGSVQMDVKQAFNFYLRSAAKNCPYGIVRVGLCLKKGVGVRRDVMKACQNFQRAAEMNHPDGQYYLGQCYEDGTIVDGTVEQAKEWYRKAAEKGNIKAKAALLRLDLRAGHL